MVKEVGKRGSEGCLEEGGSWKSLSKRGSEGGGSRGEGDGREVALAMLHLFLHR